MNESPHQDEHCPAHPEDASGEPEAGRAADVPARAPDAFRFTFAELSGSLGDLGLFLPLVVAMTLACGLNFGMVLICAGLMNVLAGLIFRQPIPVQPMKAIAVVAITEGLTRGELVASGLLLGLLLLALALSGLVGRLSGFVPKAIVRGIQLGIGVKLALRGAEWVGELPPVHYDSLLTAALAGGVLLFLGARRQPVLLYVFLAGFLLIWLGQPGAYHELALAEPGLGLYWPESGAWVGGFVNGALPQLPLTLLNSVVAVCALSATCFPGRGAAPKKMAVSVGLMNLICVPLGGIPMCHGAGGLAAQYRFGARSGGSVVMLGTMKIAAGLLFGGTLLGLLHAYPVAILGMMLIFAGVELARTARDLAGAPNVAVAVVTAAGILTVNTWAGFLAGCGVFLGLKAWTWICGPSGLPWFARLSPRVRFVSGEEMKHVPTVADDATTG